MANQLPVSGVIQISLTITPNAAAAASEATALLIGSSNVIDVIERLRTYENITEVLADFPSNSPEYLGAVPWFSQNPQPQSLSIGRWAQTATAATLIGGPLSVAEQAIATWNAINAGSLLISVNGAPYNLSGLNFAAAANMNGVAAVLQTALAAAVAGSTVAWNAVYDYLQFTSGITGPTSTISYVSTPTAVGNAVFAGQPTAMDTLTIDGTSVEFVAASPTGNEVLIGASLPTTLANLLTFLEGSADVNISKMTYSVTGSTLYIVSKATGTAGDAYTLAKSSSEITLSGATLSGGGGTDISAMTGATNLAGGGAYLAEGIAAESALACVELMDEQFGGLFYALCIPQAADADQLAIAAYIEADSIAHNFGITTQEAGTLSSVSTTDLAYQLSQLGYLHTNIQYSSTSPYAVMSYLARIATVDYTGNNTVIALMYKKEPGIVPESIGPSQAAALKAKNCNVYANYNNGTAIIQYGVQCSGNYTDLIAGCDWLKAQIQANAFNFLYSNTTKVPQTDSGMTSIANNAIDPACIQGVGNGFLAPGQWNNPGFGAIVQGQLLPAGYYVYQPPVASQSEADRTSRVSVTYQVAAKTAGAVQDVVIAVTVNQ